MERIIRDRQEDVFAEMDALDDDRDSTYPAVVIQTTAQQKYPTTPGAFYACYPVTLTGDVAEGTIPELTPDTTEILYAFNLGTSVPSPGTFILAHGSGGRLCFRWD